MSVQNPILLADSEPEPDVALLRPRDDYYASGKPQAADVLLAVEVSDTSLDYDRDVKRPLYAQAGITEYWILNLTDECLEVHRQPQPDGSYRDLQTLRRGEQVTVAALPGVTLVCPDSHTCTIGGLGALAWGIGSTDGAHALATKTLPVKRPKLMRVRFNGRLQPGVYAKDMILHLIGRYGASGGAGYAVEEADPPGFAEAARDWHTLAHGEIALFLRDAFEQHGDEGAHATWRHMGAQAAAPDLTTWLQTAARRTARQRAWAAFLAERPLLLCPVSAEPPFPQGLDVADQAGFDRVFRAPGPLRGHVVDFFELPHWPVFNVADICINAGAILMAIMLFRGVHLDGGRDG